MNLDRFSQESIDEFHSRRPPRDDFAIADAVEDETWRQLTRATAKAIDLAIPVVALTDDGAAPESLDSPPQAPPEYDEGLEGGRR